jgi:quercetin dioxygenase-like cupin family protein
MRYALLVAVLFARIAAAQDTTAERARVAVTHTLPALDGHHATVTLVEVTYGPGGGSAPHRHTCPVIAYVVSGALESRVDDGPDSTYTAGQTFYEAPLAKHVVSANASHERPVTFLAYFVCDHGPPLTVGP